MKPVQGIFQCMAIAAAIFAAAPVPALADDAAKGYDLRHVEGMTDFGGSKEAQENGYG